ncbi:MAG: DAK2 domain-containing protein [Clostridia bacterium]|nr:DAK2 domain-containing protein [Clostridia bacterium]
MIAQLDGLSYRHILHSGIQNLEQYRTVLNDLNVFPVPDGDTGTNMVMTLRYGYDAIQEDDKTLSQVAGRFASASVFGARGNSGVIVSQFFKGLSDTLKEWETASCEIFSRALENGCKYAYASVAQPVEGTILTVLKDASKAVAKALPLESIDAVIDTFLTEAKVSLAHTPDLLPILRKASVVDSGGSGIVYFFEGVQKYLRGEPIETVAKAEETPTGDAIDLSLFNKNTPFNYGYCTEGVLQLTVDPESFEYKNFKEKLADLGESVVSSLEGDKVKLHIHTKRPGKLMDFCQKYGEFLTIKMENMSVQHAQQEKQQKEARKFLYDADRAPGNYAVVAVASNLQMQQCFFDMGADVVILSDIAPSSQDFMDAFKLTSAKQILVFPNSANSILSSMQAGSLYKKAKITVLNSRSIAECYATLSILDFDSTLDEAVALANGVLSELYQLSIYQAVKDVKYGSKTIRKDDFFALSNNKILSIEKTLENITMRTIDDVLQKQPYEVVTLFYGKRIMPEYIEHLLSELQDQNYDAEFAAISTLETVYDITIIFE